MTNSATIKISGQVDSPLQVTYQHFCQLPTEFQIGDVGQLVPGRAGAAVKLAGLLQLIQLPPETDYIGLHGTHDNFHASIPLAEVKDRAVLIYQLDGKPLPQEKGGPIRFLIPDHAACHAAEIDECANVKFVDHIEFTQGKGYDNRPEDDQEHARLHEQQ